MAVGVVMDFKGATIGPYTREVGIEDPPEISFHPAHNYLLKT